MGGLLKPDENAPNRDYASRCSWCTFFIRVAREQGSGFVLVPPSWEDCGTIETRLCACGPRLMELTSLEAQRDAEHPPSGAMGMWSADEPCG
jgi:hypothetical protein